MLVSCLDITRLNAPAKLNLGLSIVGRRLDGYHELESLFWPIDFGDVLTVAAASSSTLECRWASDAPFTDSTLPTHEQNLAWKAVLQDPRARAWRIGLEKYIPMGAGLGGGSSDAGTLLRFLGQTDSQVAADLGADVPFFLNPQPTWVSGIGENRLRVEVDPSLISRLSFLVILLPVGCNTRAVFQTYQASGRDFSPRRAAPMTGRWDFEALSAHLKNAGNDLEGAACRAQPLVARVLKRLRELATPLFTGLSGSGSACFALFDDDSTRDAAAKVLTDFCRENYCRSVKAKTFQLR